VTASGSAGVAPDQFGCAVEQGADVALFGGLSEHGLRAQGFGPRHTAERRRHPCERRTDLAFDPREGLRIVGAQADLLDQPASDRDPSGRKEATQRDHDERALPEGEPHVLTSGYVRRGTGERAASVL
jgi:hypothetical protein